MPILSAEPDLFPATLLDAAAEEEPWWLVYTIARREKELMRRLRALEIPHYGPLWRQRSKSPAGRFGESWCRCFQVTCISTG